MMLCRNKGFVRACKPAAAENESARFNACGNRDDAPHQIADRLFDDAANRFGPLFVLDLQFAGSLVSLPLGRGVGEANAIKAAFRIELGISHRIGPMTWRMRMPHANDQDASPT